MKFGDAELVGVPTILAVGRGLVDGVVEIKDRRSGNAENVAVDKAVDYVVNAVPQQLTRPSRAALGVISGLESIQPGTLILIVVAGFAAGWVDAVVGGGGLIQLPALLLVPGISPVQALATNKMGSIFGTTTSAATYYRRVQPGPAHRPAHGGDRAGRQLRRGGAGRHPAASVFKPIIVAGAGRRRALHRLQARRRRA